MNIEYSHSNSVDNGGRCLNVGDFVECIQDCGDNGAEYLKVNVGDRFFITSISEYGTYIRFLNEPVGHYARCFKLIDDYGYQKPTIKKQEIDYLKITREICESI